MTGVLRPGLQGVVAAETRLSMVDGERGQLIICGHRLDELAERPFEDVAALLWREAGYGGRLQAAPLPPHTCALLGEAARARVPVIDALRMAVASLPAAYEPAETLAGAFPTIVAAYWRLLHGRDPVEPRDDLGVAANYLYMLDGNEPHPEVTRGLQTYLNTVCDHGLNASTFTARVIASTASDLISAVTGALGALKGPLHGGAPGPALQTVFEVGEAARAEEVLRAKIAAGERLMGFGHRIYKVRDPRADVLAVAAERMFSRTGDTALYELARHVEAVALRILEEHKPGQRLQTNVEFYTALLLHGIGLDVALFTPTFAIGRVVGWTAHCLEQRAAARIIRPDSVYVGARPA